MGIEMENLQRKMADYFGKPVAEQSVKKDPMIELPEKIAQLTLARFINRASGKIVDRVQKGDLSPEAKQAALLVAKAMLETIPEIGNE